MLDDGTILVSANYVYTYSLYAQTMIFSIGLLLQSICTWLRYLKPTQSWRLCVKWYIFWTRDWFFSRVLYLLSEIWKQISLVLTAIFQGGVG